MNRLAAFLVLGAVVAAGCGRSSDIVLRGSATTRERMALPPNAILKVLLSDVSVQDVAAPVLAETTLVTAGRQVPIPFELRVRPSAVQPNRTYAVRATLESAGRLLFTTDTVHRVTFEATPAALDLVLVRARSEAAHPAGEPFIAPSAVAGRLTFSAGKLRFLPCGKSTAEMLLLTDTLDNAPAALLRELGADDTGVTALVRIDGDRLVEVRYAGLEGPSCEDLGSAGDVEARGNEPFWSLSVDGASASFRTPETPDGVAHSGGTWTAESDGAWRYEAPGLVLELTPERCMDSMSGARYPYRAVLTRGATRYTGCGLEGRAAMRRAAEGAGMRDESQPAAALVGTKWRLATLGGKPALAEPAATLEFLDGDRVAGSATCNRLTGTVRTSGGSIQFGPLATTRRACMGPADEQERQVLAALQSAERFAIEGDALLLHHREAGSPLRYVRE